MTFGTVGFFGIFSSPDVALAALSGTASVVASLGASVTGFGRNAKYAMSAMARMSTAFRTRIRPSGMVRFFGGASVGFFSIATIGGGVTDR